MIEMISRLLPRIQQSVLLLFILATAVAPTTTTTTTTTTTKTTVGANNFQSPSTQSQHSSGKGNDDNDNSEDVEDVEDRQPVTPDPASDSQVCSTLVNYVITNYYDKDVLFESKCSCSLSSFVGMFQVDCDLCVSCHQDSDSCAFRQDTFRYHADRLRVNETIYDSFEGYYERFFFTEGVLAEDYDEIRIARLQDFCEVYLVERNGSGYFPCECSYKDCDNDGRRDKGQYELTFDCYELTNYTDINFSWGNCDATLDNLAVDLEAAMSSLPFFGTPFVALRPDLFTFDHCFADIPSLAPSSISQPQRGDNLAEAGMYTTATPTTISIAPTNSLSAWPTVSLAPTSSPTNGFLTEIPSAIPGAAPSSTPSMGPSASLYPTGMPSWSPTNSQKPSSMPSIGPSNSLYPSGMPSLWPTKSQGPSYTPSIGPSGRPTSIPAVGHTAAPTAAPTASPTGGPTTAPTAGPTLTPTAVPTSAPTARPTVGPTEWPSLFPSGGPTLAPTNQPTMIPSNQPSTIVISNRNTTSTTAQNGQTSNSTDARDIVATGNSTDAKTAQNKQLSNTTQQTYE